MENNNYTSTIANNDSENASFVAMTTVNQMMLPVALYSTEIPLSTPTMMNDYYSNNNNNNSNYIHYANQQPHITTTPVVKSHNPSTVMYSPPLNGYSQQTNYLPMLDTTTTNIMNNLSSMDIDDYFTSTTMDSMFPNTIYSPSSNSVTTNSSVMMMSPSSPSHMLSPTQPMDTFVTPTTTPYHHLLVNDNIVDNNIYAEAPIVPTNIGMSHHYNPHNMMYNGGISDDMMIYNHHHQHQHRQQQQLYFDRKGRRPLPRRHTVSTPYATNMVVNKGKEPMTEIKPELNVSQQPTITKSRKSSLKAKRHRSLGKLDIFSTNSSSSPPPIPDLATFEPLSAKLELWTHEQLLERVMELEKEKEASVTQTTIAKIKKEVTPDESGLLNIPTTVASATMFQVNKVRSASHTDTEMEEDEDEEEDPQFCKWDNCTIELNSLDDLINHVKTDHIGSGKANYYCCWKDCARKQKPFTKRHKMHNHLRTHTGERPFVCLEPDCGKKFSRPDSLTTHAKIHSNIRPYLCNNIDCGKAYYHLRSLRKHERSHQLKDDNISPPLPPPPLPVGMSNVTHTTTSLHPDDLNVGRGEEVYSDWGLSAQAALFNIMDKEHSSFM